MRRLTMCNARRDTRTGSVLIMATLFATVLSLIIGSLLKYSTTEMRLNYSQTNYLKASLAAESMAEYGFAELKKRWDRQTSFSVDELRNDPIVIPSTAAAFYSGTQVVYNDLELIGGNVPPGEWVYIDPSDPANQDDTQKGKRVFQRSVEVYGKGVSEATLGRREVFCAQVLAVRDAPLFSHAIFYNMDLEFHPGPRMDMNGPVHSNGDIYVQAIDRLRFFSTLMANGDFYHGYKNTGSHTQNGDVLIQNVAGDWVDVYNSGSRSNDSSYVDSNLGAAWRTAATERWSGNVGSRDHDVPKLNPIGIDDYVPDDPSTAADEKVNSAFAMIEPQVGSGDPNYKGADVQLEQVSYKAGLIFEVDKVIDAGEPGGYRYDLSAYHYERSSEQDPKSAPLANPDGTLRRIDLDLAAVEAKIGKSILSVEKYAEFPLLGYPVSGFYDQRQNVGMDVVELDIEVLTEVINNGQATTGTAADPWDGRYQQNPGTRVDWNGVVYVELPYDGSASARVDKVMPADRDIALRLVKAGAVPNPSYASGAGFDEGFSLATNGQLYVKGHFNADGLSGTGSSTETDDGLTSTSTEAPAALYADSITILSSAFDDSRSKANKNSRDAVFTEVSAAMVTGLLPTLPGTSQISGGAHNLPRFLEDWGGVQFRYRGALVAMYESEAGTIPMGNSGNNWYSPPQRNWGYNDLFAAGVYPPGSPNTRGFKRTNFRFLTEAEYNTALTTLDGFDSSTSSRGH